MLGVSSEASDVRLKKSEQGDARVGHRRPGLEIRPLAVLQEFPAGILQATESHVDRRIAAHASPIVIGGDGLKYSFGVPGLYQAKQGTVVFFHLFQETLVGSGRVSKTAADVRQVRSGDEAIAGRHFLHDFHDCIHHRLNFAASLRTNSWSVSAQPSGVL